jgi:hypothetical protein
MVVCEEEVILTAETDTPPKSSVLVSKQVLNRGAGRACWLGLIPSVMSMLRKFVSPGTPIKLIKHEHSSDVRSDCFSKGSQPDNVVHRNKNLF